MASSLALSAQSLQQQRHSSTSHFCLRLIDGCEIDLTDCSECCVVVSNDRDILRHTQAAFGECAHRAQRGEIVGDENCGRVCLLIEQRGDALSSSVIDITAGSDLDMRVESPAPHGPFITPATFGSRDAATLVNVRNSLMPEVGEMLHHQVRAD